jgi:hypothetical protein
MSGNFGSSNPMQPLSIGNVVSAAVRLYRSHFSQYLGLAFQSLLWGIIPIYGWAKASAISAMIARLAFGELVNQPEPITTTRSQLKPRLWTFFGTQILVFIILFAVNIGRGILQFSIDNILIFTVGQENFLFLLISPLVTLAGLFVYIWIYSRIFIPELPIAIEEDVDSLDSISRSWELTKGHVLRLQCIILLASLITFPLMVVALSPLIFAFISLVSTIATNPSATPGSEVIASFLIFMLIGIILFLIAAVLVSPFWQVIKAVIYYDLRNRREGLGLQLRNHDL